ncbi:MAG: hypothetical protein ABI882_02275 [Acidobacteriota bacterium]
MTRRLLPCLLLLILATVSSYAQGEGLLDAQVDRIFGFARPDSPGSALAVIRDGQIILSRGYGMADLDHDIRDGFKASNNLGTVRFPRDAAGRVSGMILSEGLVKGLRFEKLESH